MRSPIFLRAFTRLWFRGDNTSRCLHAAMKGRANGAWDEARSLRVVNKQSLDMKEEASFNSEPRQSAHPLNSAGRQSLWVPEK